MRETDFRADGPPRPLPADNARVLQSRQTHVAESIAQIGTDWRMDTRTGSIPYTAAWHTEDMHFATQSPSNAGQRCSHCTRSKRVAADRMRTAPGGRRATAAPASVITAAAKAASRMREWKIQVGVRGRDADSEERAVDRSSSRAKQWCTAVKRGLRAGRGEVHEAA